MNTFDKIVTACLVVLAIAAAYVSADNVTKLASVNTQRSIASVVVK